jgi:hypothetical protein
VMLVYGDRTRHCDPRVVIAELRGRLECVRSAPPGLERHAQLVAAFVDASSIIQGLIDAAVGDGPDRRCAIADTGMAYLVELARIVAHSWDHGFGVAPLPPLELAAPFPDEIAIRRAEGHAFYALYPEAFAAAASGVDIRHVIGIRSIGCGLAAIVAAATNAPIPATVRPRGDPFARRIVVVPALLDEWTRDRHAPIAIVDEGPGMSGSSFGAVVDALEDRGATRIACFPSHRNDLGPAASERHRTRWSKLPRHVVELEDLIVAPLARWIAELVGPLDGPLEDIGAGRWRAHRYPSEDRWPPSVIGQERRKFLARTRDGGRWIARFVGLGHSGERAIARARALSAAGFSPEIAGTCHGFLVERWHEAGFGEPRRSPGFLGHLGRYLGRRARMLAGAADRGATREQLVAMTRRNTTLALVGAGDDLDRWSRMTPQLCPVEIDGRLHAWEWLTCGDRWLKADAIDHCDAHDLVGCQDISWDLAGAVHELGLEPDAENRLARMVADESGRAIDPEARTFLRPAYLAFQLGRHAIAIDTVDVREASRLRRAVGVYALALRRELAAIGRSRR